MLTIRCARCRGKVFKYNKIGTGRVLRCYRERIIQDYSIRDGERVLCACGNVVGVDAGGRIKMRQSAFITTGTRTKG